MAKEKKRPSKRAKAAQKILKDSELLKIAKTKMDSAEGTDLQVPQIVPKPLAANKSRPDKKRG